MADKAVFGALDGLLARLGHKLPLMRALGAYLRSSTRERFETQTAPDGSRWKPSIRAQLGGGVTLVDHGILRDSFIDSAGEDFARVGTSDVRAGTFQFGRTKDEPVAAHSRTIRQAFGRPLASAVTVQVQAHTRNPNIVARPMVGVSIEDREEIVGLASDFLEGGMAEGAGA
nr:phage virion morphogenesis protein [Caulobacter sp. SLTY]